MKKWFVIPALAGAVVLGGVTMAVNAEKSDVVTSEGLLTIEEAKGIAIEAVGGKVTEIEFEREKSHNRYEVEVKSDGVEYDLDIDANTGEIVQTRKDNHDDKSRVSAENVLTVEEAVAIAMQQAKGTVMKVELDEDDGRLQYEIEIEDSTYEYDFEIDAKTGTVIEFEKDHSDD